MALQAIIRWLLPRQDHFYDLLERQAVIGRDTAAEFARFKDPSYDAEKVCSGVQALEHEGDAIVHEIDEALARTFVTPIDREDIQRLSNELDEIIDLVNHAARACTLMGVDRPTEPMCRLVDVLVMATEELAKAVPMLRAHRYGDLITAKRKLRKIEKEGDKVYRDAMSVLFRSPEIDAKVLLREREVLEDLESAVDACEVVADTLATLAVNMVELLIFVVITALVFDFINGFHDAANAIATVVSTGVLPIRTAVIIAGIFNFVGAIAGTAVAKTIASGFADTGDVTQGVVLSALIGAIIWNLLTWWWGIPSSSSHALIGGLAGAVVGHASLGAFNWGALVSKVMVPLVLSPLIGFTAAFLFMITLIWAVRNVRAPAVHRTSRRLQLVSACTMAFSHGSNDAQKAMGIITLAVVSHAATSPGTLPAWALPAEAGAVPSWVVFACAIMMGFGTMAGGKRIIKTMGTKIIRISPLQGFAAETGGALTILGASQLGVPVLTTHVINACIMGVGASKRISAVRWGVAGNIMLAWVVTLPMSAGFAFLSILAFDAIWG